MNNTLTPWTASAEAVLDADNNVICIAIDDQDAERIVMAVNNHERLMQRLKEVTEQLEDDDMDMRCMDNLVADAARRLLNDLTASQPPHTT